MPKNTAAPSRPRSVLAAALAALLALGAAAPVRAGTGAEAAGFLDIPVGGRPAGMGGAYTALASDAYAPVWNPGGLAFVGRTELATMHLNYLQSMSYEFLSAARGFSVGGFGMAAQYFRPGGISGADATGQPIADFQGHYAAYSLAYGRALTPKLGAGISTKILDADIGGVRGRGYAFDAGTMYRWDERLTVGASLDNMGSRMRFLAENDRLPTSFRAGASYWAYPEKLALSLDGVASKSTTGFRAGAELKLLKMLALRAGMDTTLATQRENALFGGLTMGVGLEFAGQQFDYAWVPRGDLGSTSYFSVVVRFGQFRMPSLAPAAAPPSAASAAPAPQPFIEEKPAAKEKVQPNEKAPEAPQQPAYEQSTPQKAPPLLWLDN
jgi:hypothetical protein